MNLLRDDDETEIGSYFRSNLINLRQRVDPSAFKKFASLQSNDKRVAFVLSYPEAHELAIEKAEKKKDDKKATFLKDLGNKYFGSGQYLKAMENYSSAALFATPKELGVILANRSAALYHQSFHKLALADIEEALRVGYPKELQYKLEERRAKCYLGLKDNGRAVESFRKTLQALDDAKISPEKKHKLASDSQIMLALLAKDKRTVATNKLNNTKPMKKIVPKIENPQELYPDCDEALRIIDEGGVVGRRGVATRDIKAGEVLIVDKPHCAALLPHQRLSHCHRCLIKIVAPIPTECCTSVAYCSVKCRQLDSRLHNVECEILNTLWSSNASITCILAIKIIMQMPYSTIDKLKKELNELNGQRAKVSKQRVYKSNDYLHFQGLVTHEEERTSEDLFHRAYMAAWLLRLLKNTPFFPDGAKSFDIADAQLTDSELFIGGLLLHHLQVLQFNSHEISELEIPGDSQSFDKAKSMFVGGGVYPLPALLNHSCNPSVIRYFIGTTMVIRAIRTIHAGEEIADNYGPIFTMKTKKERQRALMNQYWFSCKCEPCENDWPLLSDIDPSVLRFKCETGPSCGNVIPINIDTQNFVAQCKKCGKNINIFKGLKALQDTDSLFKTASNYVKTQQLDKALSNYLDILRILDENLALPIRDYHLCQQKAKLCMLTCGNKYTA